MKTSPIPSILLGGALLLSACASLQQREVSFVDDVKPLLEHRCLECHNHQYKFANLNLETKELAMKGSRSGPVIVPGDPEKSLLYKVQLLGHNSPVAMPPSPDRLLREDQKILHDWIKQGAEWPDGVRLIPPQEWPGGIDYHP